MKHSLYPIALQIFLQTEGIKNSKILTITLYWVNVVSDIIPDTHPQDQISLTTSSSSKIHFKNVTQDYIYLLSKYLTNKSGILRTPNMLAITCKNKEHVVL